MAKAAMAMKAMALVSGMAAAAEAYP